VRIQNADMLIRSATAGVVIAVAGIAAVVSYSHIFDLAHAHGQDGTAARLLPLSVDGLILAASLVMLHEARNRRDSPFLAQAMLGLGVGATLAANAAYGAPCGLLGIAVSTWPAVSFIGSVEMAMLIVRRSRTERKPIVARPLRRKTPSVKLAPYRPLRTGMVGANGNNGHDDRTGVTT
jgi:hypothetical protein